MKYMVKEICFNGKRNDRPFYHRYSCYSNNQKIIYDDLEKAIRDAESTVNTPHNGVISYSIEEVK